MAQTANRGYNAMRGIVAELREDLPQLYPPSLPDDRLTVPSGWAAIVRRLSQRLQHKPIVVQQVKEKGGGLRWYFAGVGDDEIAAAITEAEAAALVTCDVCGSPRRCISDPSTPYGQSWLCDGCGSTRMSTA